MGSTGSELRVEAVTPLPERIAVGGGSALFLDGRCSWPDADIDEVLVAVGGVEQPVMGWGLAPPRDRGDEYWWAIVGFDRPAGEERLEVSLRVRSAGGEVGVASLGEIIVEPDPAAPPPVEPPPRPEAAGGPLVAICMATYEPEMDLFRAQINSIREQTHRSWVCLISDDGSSATTLEAMSEAIAGDPRFALSAATANRGFYLNFERALLMVPPEADFVALSDQDDRWREDKIELLLAGLEEGRRLVYSDMRITDRRGEVIAPTYWGFRPNNYSDFGSLMLANTVTGGACLFDSGLLPDLLPFPPRHSALFHDHWIAEVAMALGGISYVDAPLQDYVQHDSAALGYLQANGGGRYSAPWRQRVGIWYGRWSGRGYRLGWRPPYFRVFCRVALTAEALRRRLGPRLRPDHARVLDLIADRPAGWAWLAGRAMRDLRGTSATLGRERVILSGLAWRHGAEVRKRLRRTRRRPPSPAGRRSGA